MSVMVGLCFSTVGGDSAPRGHHATAVNVTTGVRAPGIEWMGPGMLLSPSQRPGRTPIENDSVPVSAVLGERPCLI